MLYVNVKSKEQCLEIAKKEYRNKFGIDLMNKVTEDELLDYLPDDVFNGTFKVNDKVVDDLGVCYYIGNMGWALDELFVDKLFNM